MHPLTRTTTLLLLLLFTISLGPGCAYRDRVAPVRLPDETAAVVVAGGLKISAESFVDPERAQRAFGFNARAAGLLPVQLTFQNDTTETVYVNTEQTFLIDDANRAWPILRQEQAVERAKGYVDIGETAKESAKPSLLMGAAGAIAGAAIGVVTGENVGEAAAKGAAVGAATGLILGGAKGYTKSGEKIRSDISAKSLAATAILPNQIGYGVLFFPGHQEDEANTARELRLSLTIGNRTEVVRLPLAGN